MKTTLQLNQIIDEEHLKPYILQATGLPDVWDTNIGYGRVTVDWDVELVKQDRSAASKFNGFDSYAYLVPSLKKEAVIEFNIQYYINENDPGEYIDIDIPLITKTNGFVETVKYDNIQPMEVDVNFEEKIVFVSF